MIAAAELLAWLSTLGTDAAVGIDDGGLTLWALDARDHLTGASVQIGGLPQEQEPTDDHLPRGARG